jgi:hypothetical protein
LKLIELLMRLVQAEKELADAQDESGLGCNREYMD